VTGNQNEESKSYATNANSAKPGSMHSKRSSKLPNNVEDINEEDNFEEQNKAFPKFLMNLPGITATDSLSYKIEALRVYLED